MSYAAIASSSQISKQSMLDALAELKNEQSINRMNQIRKTSFRRPAGRLPQFSALLSYHISLIGSGVALDAHACASCTCVLSAFLLSSLCGPGVFSVGCTLVAALL
jgi:hypothetical protein